MFEEQKETSSYERKSILVRHADLLVHVLVPLLRDSLKDEMGNILA